MLHHHFSKGKKVIIALRNGTKKIDKYISSNSNKIVFENRSYKWEEIRSTTIYNAKIRI